MSSFLSQGKFIPLSMVPLVLELELDDSDQSFEGNGNQWVVTRPRLIADVLTLDNALQNSCAKHILDGRSLPSSMHGLYSLQATVTSSSQFSLPINRGFSRLSTIYFSFIRDGKESTEFLFFVKPGPGHQGSDHQGGSCLGRQHSHSQAGQSHVCGEPDGSGSDGAHGPKAI